MIRIITLLLSFDYSGMSTVVKERVKKTVCELECANLGILYQEGKTNIFIERHCQQTHEEFALVNGKLDCSEI